MQSREEMLDRMRYLYRGLISIENLTNLKNDTLNQVSRLQNEINYESNRRNKGIRQSQKDVKKSNRTATGIAVLVSGIICGIVFILSLILGALLRSLDEGDEITRQATINLSIFFFVLGVIITVIVAIVTRGVADSVNQNIVNKSKRSIPDAENKIAGYQSQIDTYVENLYDADSKIAISFLYIDDLVKSFPPDYCYSYAVGKIISYIQNLRADSLKEAINLFEDEEYKNKMYAEQRKQTEFAKISAAANIQTAYNTGLIADYSRQIVENTADIAQSNRMIAANTRATAEYSRAAAAYSAQGAANIKNIRDRVCPSFWD
ncbi:MAG: hypothetical protein J6O71_01645 [Lachnospiraceae bacterium]|nr:hypothetical protein [Lachnospiraceae bacterium]